MNDNKVPNNEVPGKCIWTLATNTIGAHINAAIQKVLECAVSILKIFMLHTLHNQSKNPSQHIVLAREKIATVATNSKYSAPIIKAPILVRKRIIWKIKLCACFSIIENKLVIGEVTNTRYNHGAINRANSPD